MKNSVDFLTKNIKYGGRCVIGNSRFTEPLLGLTKMKSQRVRIGTDICIEGFPRSANSFAYHYFKRANPDLCIAHHIHVPSQLEAAVQLRVPLVVLLRKPLDAIQSLMIIYENLSVGLALWSYERSYSITMRHLDRVVLSRFETTINSPEIIVRCLNDRFNLELAAPKLSNSDRESIFKSLKAIAESEKQRYQVAIPSADKQAAKLAHTAAIYGHKRYPKVQELYKEMLIHAV